MDAGCGATDTTDNCGACGRACSTTNASATACTSGGTCSPTCRSGYTSCQNPAAPSADDGCECATPGCCATTGGCAVTHQNCIGGSSQCGSGQNAIGQSYWLSTDYCAAVGVPGTASTYTMAMGLAAANAAPQATVCSNPPCVGVSTCTSSTTAQDAVYDDLTDMGGPCIVWAFDTTGSGQTKAPAGHVHIDPLGCYCPTSSDPTWD